MGQTWVGSVSEHSGGVRNVQVGCVAYATCAYAPEGISPCSITGASESTGLCSRYTDVYVGDGDAAATRAADASATPLGESTSGAGGTIPVGLSYNGARAAGVSRPDVAPAIDVAIGPSYTHACSMGAGVGSAASGGEAPLIGPCIGVWPDAGSAAR